MDSQTSEQRDLPNCGIIAFQATRELIARVEKAAAAEGLSKSAVARRALMRDLKKTAAA